jgi:hypothetical protein
MVPAEGRLVDFSERETTTLVGLRSLTESSLLRVRSTYVFDVSEVIDSVVERAVPSCCLDGHCKGLKLRRACTKSVKGLDEA